MMSGRLLLRLVVGLNVVVSSQIGRKLQMCLTCYLTRMTIGHQRK